MVESEIRVLGPSPIRCPWCHDSIDVTPGEWVACGACLARHHTECWGESQSCASCREKVSLGVPGRIRVARVGEDVSDFARRRERRAKMRARMRRLGAAFALTTVLWALLATIVIFAEGSAIAPFNYSPF